MSPPAEEFLIEEFDDVPDWNAAAWAHIQARDAKALPLSQLGNHLAAATLDSLANIKAVLTRGTEDTVLLDAIAAEIERRRTNGTPATL